MKMESYRMSAHIAINVNQIIQSVILRDVINHRSMKDISLVVA